MEHQSEPKRCKALHILAAITAAVAAVNAFVITPEPAQLFCETLAFGAILSIICISNRLSGGKFSWNPILLAIVFLFPNPGTSAFSAAALPALLLAASFMFTLLSIETSRADYAADAVAIVTAAAFICPPTVWLLIPLAALLAAKSLNPLKLLAGEAAGILMAVIAASGIIILACGAANLPERLVAFGAGIQDIGKPVLSFNGWRSLRLGAFILSFLYAVTLFFAYRTRLKILEAAKIETTAVFLLSLIPIGIIYGNSMGRPAAMLYAAFSAFLICDILRVTKCSRTLAFLLFACLIFTLAEIISGFIPEMNEVFAIFVV